MTRILLVGCGRMGGALLDGWLDQGIAPADLLVIEPNGAPISPSSGVRCLVDAESIPADFEPAVVVLAVKPQVMAEVLPRYRRFSKAVFLSIAAGKTLAFFKAILGPDAAIVRAMPNTPAAVRRGVTAAIANPAVTDAQKQRSAHLLSAVGAVYWIDDEALMDPVTAVSGSGPAYVFLLAETLANAGRAAGLPDDIAAQLARQTIIGAGELLRQSTETPETLRQNVTSPNGTTAAALAVLMSDHGLGPLLAEAVAAAAHRSRELAGS